MERSEFKTLIRKDNWQEIDYFLNTKTSDERLSILNGIPGDNIIWTLEKETTGTECGSKDLLPIFQTVINGSLEVFKVFVRHGANINQTDSEHEWNIIHHLVIISNYQKKYETKCAKTYNKLKSILQQEVLLELLKMVDKDGLRPLELAVHASCIEMFNAIINTEVMYVLKKEELGLKERLWYDVTEYERTAYCQENRWKKSPLRLLMYCDKSVVQNKESVEILRSDLLKQWTSTKLKSNIIFILIWAILRTICVYAFYMVIANNTKQLSMTFYLLWNETLGSFTYTVYTNETCSPFIPWYIPYNYEKYPNMLDYNHVGQFFIFGFCAAFVLFFSVVSIMFDILEKLTLLCRKSRNWRKFQGKRKDRLCTGSYYRISQFLFSITSVFYLAFLIIEILIPDDQYSYINVALLIPACLVSAPSILYFLQVCPYIGDLVIGIERMISVMLIFLGLFYFYLTPYAHAFLTLLKGDNNCQVKDFETLSNAIYTSFKVMLNMVDFSSYGEKGKIYF